MNPAPHPESAERADAVGTNRWYLSSAPIVRALVHLCVPMAAAMIVGALYNLINAGVIGSLHDTALLAVSPWARRSSAWSWASAMSSGSAAAP